jgi:hypothetical protein
MWLFKKVAISQRPNLLTYKEDVLDLFQKAFPFLEDAVSEKNSPYKISYHLYDRLISLMDPPGQRKLIPFINFELVVDGPQRERVFLNSTEGKLFKKYHVTAPQIQQWFGHLFDWLAEKKFKVLELEVSEKGLNHLDFYTVPPMNFVESYRQMIKNKNLIDFVRMQRELPKR